MCRELHDRCLQILRRADRSCVEIDNVRIEHFIGSTTVSLMSSATIDSHGDSWRGATVVFDSRAYVAEQRLSEIREIVMPVLRRHMVLEDLSGV
jgi:hypothetical protein